MPRSSTSQYGPRAWFSYKRLEDTEPIARAQYDLCLLDAHDI